MGVVPAFNEIEHRHPRLDLGLESVAVEQLAFECDEEMACSPKTPAILR